jgi:hypothetical protein
LSQISDRRFAGRGVGHESFQRGSAHRQADKRRADASDDPLKSKTPENRLAF